MKTLTLLITILLFWLSSINGTVRTVSNHALGGSQYSTLQLAYNASVNGDTLIIEGTTDNYFIDNSWSKQLTVIGAGFNTQKIPFQRTRIDNLSGCCSGQAIFDNGASNSKFYGIYFVAAVGFGGNPANLLFEDCQFSSNFSYQNQGANNTSCIFRNCVFDADNTTNVNLSGSFSGIFSFNNCIFDGFINGNNNLNHSVTIDHCIFLRTTGASIQGLKNASINNSIFMNESTIGDANTTGCNFLNNIASMNVSLPLPGCTGSGNLVNSNPNFLTYTLGSLYSISWDFHLQAGSPGIAVASDGTDIGIHGGLSKFNESGEPLIAPVVRNAVIQNTTVAPNGTINIQLSISKPSDN